MREKVCICVLHRIIRSAADTKTRRQSPDETNGDFRVPDVDRIGGQKALLIYRSVIQDDLNRLGVCVGFAQGVGVLIHGGSNVAHRRIGNRLRINAVDTRGGVSCSVIKLELTTLVPTCVHVNTCQLVDLKPGVSFPLGLGALEQFL